MLGFSGESLFSVLRFRGDTVQCCSRNKTELRNNPQSSTLLKEKYFSFFSLLTFRISSALVKVDDKPVQQITHRESLELLSQT